MLKELMETVFNMQEQIGKKSSKELGMYRVKKHKTEMKNDSEELISGLGTIKKRKPVNSN